jgi:D-alanyl-D-alanine carboxypeptidase (penicillin-binding protein 5/6)
MFERICFLITCLFFPFCLVAQDLTNLAVKAESAILINAETGAILFEKNARQQLFPASITKIATAIYALKVRGEKLDKVIAAEHDSVASISEEEMERSNYSLPSFWLTPGASHIGIKRGEELSLKDLLYGTMIASGGDASNVIAQYIGGTIPNFIKLLNEYLQEIGCKDTVFKNPHGLHHPGHVTTAFDMALLTREAMKDRTFKEIVRTVTYTRPKTNKQSPTTLMQTNRLLRRGKFYYPKAIGVKTGYHSKAQNTIVAAATDGERTLIAVLMKCKDREDILKDSVKLFEEAFKEKKVKRQLLTHGKQKQGLQIPNASSAIKTYLKDSVVLEYYPSEEPKVKCFLHWDKVVLPVEKDQKVGTMCLQDQNGKVLAEQPLYAAERVNYNLLYRIKTFIVGSFWIKLFAGVVACLVIGAAFLKR